MIYEYKCSNCNVHFEHEQKITEKPKKKCKSCGKFTLIRLISKSDFVLKGAGWYKDGYR
jgi:putative FmdB family regulatory protein